MNSHDDSIARLTAAPKDPNPAGAAKSDGVRIKSVFIPHNTVKWEYHTNRHTTTRGNSWGCISGPKGNFFWSNDDNIFNSKDAAEAVRIHNEWIEDQKPLAFKIIEAREALDIATIEADKLEKDYRKAIEKQNSLGEELERLDSLKIS